MARTNLLKGIGVFAIVVIVVVGATAATGTLLSGASPSGDTEAPAYDSGLLPTAVDDSGTVEPPQSDETKTVVIDQSHGNAVGESDMEPLVDALIESGHDVRFYSGGTDSGFGGGTGGLSSGGSGLNATLRSADAFVVANPASAYTSGEINGIESFADAGGRVLLLADPVPPSASTQSIPVNIPIGTGSGTATTPGQPTNLAANFGISFGAGYLFDMENNANNYQRIYADPSGDDALTAGADRLVFDDATALTTDADATPIVQSDAQSSATRRDGTYPVAVRTDSVVAIGNTEFLAPDSATVADNDAFVSNIASFLVTGDKQPGVPEPADAATGPGTGTGGFGDQPDTTPTLPGNGTSP
ncbi:hypothetical protein SAMN05216388_1004143 [Halorientalis persicus]|uniref:GATase domain protein n=1 Tax=Halorientalis persicus TaxID=1367881 RepID=A0A1H8ID26_9EURY|nr:hypothetical protein [Halorientalis persicus]SEN66693.1 hypothetical protein SAMN05216388_1004143 [Halorientalis persicus]